VFVIGDMLAANMGLKHLDLSYCRCVEGLFGVLGFEGWVRLRWVTCWQQHGPEKPGLESLQVCRCCCCVHVLPLGQNGRAAWVAAGKVLARLLCAHCE
jgi:hypothetical protein